MIFLGGQMVLRTVVFLLLILLPLGGYAGGGCSLKNSFFCGNWRDVRDGLMITVNGHQIISSDGAVMDICTVAMEREFHSELYSLLSCIDDPMPPVAAGRADVPSAYLFASRPSETWHDPSSRTMQLYMLRHNDAYAACLDSDPEVQKKCDFEDFFYNYVERHSSWSFYNSEP